MSDKYIFETKSNREMELVVNRNTMLLALSELREWRRLLYRGRDCDDGYYSISGKIYPAREIIFNNDFPRDERGFIKDISKKFYYVDDIIDKIDDILSDINDLIERNL